MHVHATEFSRWRLLFVSGRGRRCFRTDAGTGSAKLVLGSNTTGFAVTVTGARHILHGHGPGPARAVVVLDGLVDVVGVPAGCTRACAGSAPCGRRRKEQGPGGFTDTVLIGAAVVRTFVKRRRGTERGKGGIAAMDRNPIPESTTK